MAGGCRSIFHRLNCITAPKIISPAYGEAACSYSNPVPYKPNPARVTRAALQPKQSIRGSGRTCIWRGGVKYEPGVFLERGLVRRCCGLCLWDLSLCLQSSREESRKQQLHLWSLPEARGGRRRKRRRRRWVLCGLLQCLGPALLCHTCVMAWGRGMGLELGGDGCSHSAQPKSTAPARGPGGGGSQPCTRPGQSSAAGWRGG